jgi:MtN3 and saliva related transmembrane protein
VHTCLVSDNSDIFIAGVGIAASVLIAISFIPQIRKAVISKSMEDVSAYLILLLMIGSFLWVLYGIFKTNLVLIGANTANLTSTICLMVLKFKYRNNNV